MKKISYILPLLFLLLTTACQVNKQNITDESSANIPPNYEGVYKGTFPCADCPGIESKLTLNKDKTFVYEQTYINEIDGHFTDRGNYTVKDNIVMLQEKNAPVYFLIKDQELLLLDNDLKPAEGALAPYYKLKKQGDFIYPGKYETFYEKEEEYKQTLSISAKGENYQVDFSASKVKGRENCHFSGTAWLENGKLWANISTEENREVLMYIAPTHDNLGVEVFTADFEERFHLMRYCRGGSSLAGDYIKNTITADNIGIVTTSTTIEDILHTIPLTQLHKKIGRGEFADDIYDDYEIWTRNNQHLFTLTPKKAGDSQQKVERVLIQSPFFKTARGIHCNSTYQDIDNAYTITEILPDMEHIIVIVDEINASFSIPKTELPEGWWNDTAKTVNRNKIPADAQIDNFVLWWNQ